MSVSEQTPVVGVLSALGPELGRFRRGERSERVLGLELVQQQLAGVQVVACAAGVGKVAAAHGAAVLLGQGAQALWIVGTCGGLLPELRPGTQVHCQQAIQADLAVREGRASEPDEALLALWRSAVPGPLCTFLSADRPVLNPWRRRKLRRAFPGLCVADMETAAAAAVASRAGVPWGALRTVTDGAGFGAGSAFRENLAAMAGLAADTLPSVLSPWRLATSARLS